jgi:hypothetical protein
VICNKEYAIIKANGLIHEQPIASTWADIIRPFAQRAKYNVVYSLLEITLHPPRFAVN